MKNILYDIVEDKDNYVVIELVRKEDSKGHKSIKVVRVPKSADEIIDTLIYLEKLNKDYLAEFEVDFKNLKMDIGNSIAFTASNLEIIEE